MTPPLPTNAGKHPGVSCVKSGKWVAKVRHPTRKILVCVGIYSTPQEAADAYKTKKLEYESTSVAPSSYTNNASEKQSGFKRVSSGKWAAKIRRNNLEVWLGTYDTPNEASDAYYMSKLELDSQGISCSAKACAVKPVIPDNETAMTADLGQLKKQQRPCHAYLTKSGRWKAEIRHPLTKVNTHLGTFDTAEEAQECFYDKRREFELMFPGYMKGKHSNNKMGEFDLVVSDDIKMDKQLNNSCESVHSGTCTEGAEECFRNMMCEFDLMVRDDKKPKQSNSGCEAEASEERGEFGLGIIDSYGRLVGEYCRLDDELWIC